MAKREGIRISVEAIFPWADDPVRMDYNIDPLEAEDCLTSLPRDREIDFIHHQAAIEKRIKRERLAKMVGDMISHAILTACEKNDTIRGYKKGELTDG